MSESTQTCPKCRAPIPAEAPQGLCPKCLLAQASFPTETGPGTRHTRPLPPGRDELAAAFPHLQILELIGQGGMGFVFKARQAKLDRLVALKILAQPLAEQASFAERFTREGRTLAKLNHPNIVTIHDFGQAGPFFYLLMEFVDGVNLRQAMRAGAVTADQALAIVPKICEALQYAHNEGVLHRDIKPDNILLDTRGRVKIADFGIAKLMAEAAAENPLTGSGASLGTPHYMAPEQIERPNTVDHRADIFSLGVVFYEMLTGELPLGRFAAPSQTGGVDPRLDDVVLQTLEKQPERRPQSAEEVRTKVEDIAAKPEAPRQPTKSRSSAKSVLVMIAVILAGILFFLIAAFILYLNLARREPRTKTAVPATISPAAETKTVQAGSPTKSAKILDASKNGRTIRLRTKADLSAGETLIPLVRYGSSTFGPSDATHTGFTYHWPINETERSFSWTLPESFAPDFEGVMALQTLNTQWTNKTIQFANNTTFELFASTNAQKQGFGGGLYYRKDASTQPTERFATVTLSEIRHAFFDVGAVAIQFRTTEGLAWRVVPTFRFDDGSFGATMIRTSDSARDNSRDARWFFSGATSTQTGFPRSDIPSIALKDTQEIQKQINALRNIHARLSVGSPLRIFTIKDGDRTGSAYLELQPAFFDVRRSGFGAHGFPRLVDFNWSRATVDKLILSLQTSTPFYAGETLEAVRKLAAPGKDGFEWDLGQSMSRVLITREPGKHSVIRDFQSMLPADFSPEFDLQPEWQRFKTKYSQEPFPLFPNESTPLLKVTSSAKPSLTAMLGFRFTQPTNFVEPDKAIAKIRGFRQTGPFGNFRFNIGDLSDGYRIEAIEWINNDEGYSSTMDLNGNEGKWTEAHWIITAESTAPERWTGATDFEVTLAKPLDLFTATNRLGQILRGQLVLIDTRPARCDFTQIALSEDSIFIEGEAAIGANEKLRLVTIHSDGSEEEHVTTLSPSDENLKRINCIWKLPEGLRQNALTFQSQLQGKFLRRQIALEPGGNFKLLDLGGEQFLALQFLRTPPAPQ